MGKIKIQTIFILLLLVCGLSCTDADLRPKKEVKKFIESISVQDDKELLALIGELYNKKNKPSGRTLGTSFGEINLDKALKLNDTVFNRTRYTLGLVPTTDNFVFENIVISVREEGVFHYILRYAPDKEWLFRSPIDQNWSQYTGKITQLDFEGNIVVEATLINGQSIGKKNSGGRTSECCTWEVKYSSTTGRPYIDINCGEGGQYISYLRTSSCGGGDGGGASGGGGGGSAGGGSGGSGGGGYGDGGGGGGGGTGSGAGGDGGYSNPIGVFPQYKVCPGDDAQVPLDYPCPGDGMTNDESAINTWEDYQIFDSQLKPCMQSILVDLKALTQGSVGQIIQKFSGTIPGYNWEVKDGSLIGGQNAFTNQVYNRSTGTVATTFDGSKFTNSSELSIGRTILHESVHAYLVAYFKNDPLGASKSYPDLVSDWTKGIYGDQNTNQHAEFVRNFVTNIAVSLEEYGNSKGYAIPTQFYSDLAWGGLTHTGKLDTAGNPIETTWFQSSFPSSTDRQRIIDNITIEQTGKDFYGNPKTKKGTNAGC